MERFSPIYNDRQEFPARFIRPEASYAYVYPRSVQLDKVAYFFDYELEDALPGSAYVETTQWIQTWQAAWQDEQGPTLTYWSFPGFLQIEDARNPATPGTYTFVDSLASLYVACSNHPHSATELKEQLALLASVDEINSALDEFCSRGLMMREGNTFLSLALPANIER
jgi:hypothetical protein